MCDYETVMLDYERRVFKHLTKVPITKEELVADLSIKDNVKYNLEEIFYDIVTESACEMGVPTHVVRLGKRFWMAANPQDFLIFFNHNGSALTNLRPNKAIVWLISK